MTQRRAGALTLSVVLLIALGLALAFLPVPYVTFSVGPTVDVFGTNAGKPIVQVQGHRTYPTEGQLRLSTVYITRPDRRIGLLEALDAWVDPDDAVYPRKAIYPDANTSNDDERAESAAQMVSSQDNAIAAALTQLGYHLHATAEVLRTSPGAPADGRLETRDVFLRINGTKIGSVEDVYDAIGKLSVGDKAEIVVRRGSQRKSVTLTTVASDDDPKRAVIGVFLGQGYDFPFDVSVQINDTIGGPSAGLVFALAVYDTLTPGSLTGGVPITGTGSISDAKGTVGSIGGIQQKISAAQEAGAKLFLVPKDNCDEAAEAHLTTDIRLVRVDSLPQAIDSIQRYVADPNTDLPACEAAS